MLTNSPPATIALLPCRSMPSGVVGEVAGVPMNVRLPPLKNSGELPVLVNCVGADTVPGAIVSVP